MVDNPTNIFKDSESFQKENDYSQSFFKKNQYDCINKIHNNNKAIKNWTKEEDEILLEISREFEFKSWKKISQRLNGRSAIQCSARYKRIKPGTVKGSWSQEEDEKLENFIKRFGKNWSLISKYMPTRSGKQIRDRYLNTLDPTILKEKFSYEEDKKIVELYKKYGSSWSLIAGSFSGRTGDIIKNRFYSSLKKNINLGNNSLSKENDIVNENSMNTQNNLNKFKNLTLHENFAERKIDDFTYKKKEQYDCVFNVQNSYISSDKKEKMNNEPLNKKKNYKNVIYNLTNGLSQDEKPTNTITEKCECLHMNHSMSQSGKQINSEIFIIQKKRKITDSGNNNTLNNMNKNQYISHLGGKKNSNFEIGKNTFLCSDFDIDISSLEEDILKTEDNKQNINRLYLDEIFKLNENKIYPNSIFLMDYNNIKKNPYILKNCQLKNSREKSYNPNYGEILNLLHPSSLNSRSSDTINNNLNNDLDQSHEEKIINLIINNIKNSNFLKSKESNGLTHSSNNFKNNIFNDYLNTNINNSNFIDFQMDLLINNLLESKHSRITYCRDELENQLNILIKLLDFTHLKLEYLKNNDHNSI